MPTQEQMQSVAEQRWRELLTNGHKPLRIVQALFRALPAPPRCKECYAPYKGVGGTLVGLRLQAVAQEPELLYALLRGARPRRSRSRHRRTFRRRARLNQNGRAAAAGRLCGSPQPLLP